MNVDYLGPLPSTLQRSKSGSFLGSCGRTGDQRMMAAIDLGRAVARYPA